MPSASAAIKETGLKDTMLLLTDLTDDALEVVLQLCSLSTLRTARVACQRCARLGRSAVRGRPWQELGENLDELRISMWSEGDFRCAELSGHLALHDVFDVSMGDGMIASASHDGSCKLWDAASGTCHRTLYPKWPPSGMSLRCTALATGRLACGDNAGAVHVWDIEKPVDAPGTAKLLGHRNSVLCLAWAGQTLLSSGIDRTVRVWDVDKRECVASAKEHERPVRSLDADGGVVASGGEEGTVKLWSLANDRALAKTASFQAHDGAVMAVALRGPLLVSGSADGTLRLWDSRKGSGADSAAGLLYTPQREVYALALCGHALVSGGSDRKVSIHDMRSLTEGPHRTLTGHMSKVHAIAAEGGRIVSGDGAGRLRRWELSGT